MALVKTEHYAWKLCDSQATGVSKSRFIVVYMEKGMQVMIITIALLTQKNVTPNFKPNFANPCIPTLW